MIARRIVFKGPMNVVIEEFEVPKVGRGQILIKTRATLISTGTELTMLSGRFPKGSFWDQITNYPLTPGYSNCGVVVEVGEEVKDFMVGDRVASKARHAEYAVIESKEAVKVPDEVSDEEATFSTLAATVLNGVRRADISLGETVVILGLGILGQLACQFARLSGGFPVIAVDLSDKRLEIAKKLGVKLALNPKRDDVDREIKKVTNGKGADVVFEVTGNPEVVGWGLKLTRRQGRFILLSSPRGPTTIDFHDEVNWPSRVIIGAHTTSHPEFETPYNPWTQKRNVELFLNLVREGLVNVKDLITDRYPWYKAKDVYMELLDPLGERLNRLGVILDFR